MGTVIVITGALASLKSTIAHQLKYDLNAVLLTKDSIKEKVYDVLPSTNRTENKVLSVMSVQLMFHVLKHQINDADTFIVEANFKDIERAQLQAIMTQLKLHQITLFLTGETDTLYARYQARQKERHIAHKSVLMMTQTQFEASMPTPHKDDFIVDTTVFNESDYQKLRHLIHNAKSLHLD